MYIETGNATEAAMKVYDVKDRESAGSIGSENLKKLAFSELMEEMGLTDVALVNMGIEGATKPVKQSITGEVYPDYGVRHKYWQTLLSFKKPQGVTLAQQFNIGGEMKIEFIQDERD